MIFVRNLSLLAAGLVYTVAAQAGPVKEDKDSLYKPTGKSYSELDIESMNKPERAAVLRAQASSNLTYQGGPVMVAPTKMYYIWYGSQWDAASKNTLNNLGNLARAQNRMDDARQAFREALDIYQRAAARLVSSGCEPVHEMSNTVDHEVGGDEQHRPADGRQGVADQGEETVPLEERKSQHADG